MSIKGETIQPLGRLKFQKKTATQKASYESTLQNIRVSGGEPSSLPICHSLAALIHVSII